MRVTVLNGPNLNLLGTRRTDVYGTTTLPELDELCHRWGAELGIAMETHQSNHEGVLIDRIHAAVGRTDALVINPGALTHYSYAIHDAIEAVALPTVEVHISNIKNREPWRRHSVVAPVAVATIYGRGIHGYLWALRHLTARAAWPIETIRYGSEDDQIGDLRLPEAPGPHPVAVLIHGGFWRDRWGRDILDRAAVDLAERGWATWNIEYRRVDGGGGWPMTLHDVGDAIDALAGFAPGHGLDLERTVVIGHSAGGQLALWSARRPRVGDSVVPESALRPSAVVGLAAVTDLAAAHHRELGANAVETFLGRSPDDDSGRYASASPAALLPLGVPLLMVHGDEDDVVPVEFSRTFAGDAADAGDPVIYHELERTGHYDLTEPGTAAWATVAAELERLKQ